MSLVGKTEMGAEFGEGIVIKNMTKRKYGIYYVKIVPKNMGVFLSRFF